ncbi:helix-turn-helix transcriptional regulator [Prevotella sp. 10(H)]|uniref:helix-turn-helix transcriptional regulator n=1 Tax=Prevotella sp. 10(H) TaxID=1158294 RepID=UPI0004A75ED0|nr:helix-turn-helix transcriptional regulator [Prevotella sp. 10(H)]
MEYKEMLQKLVPAIEKNFPEGKGYISKLSRILNLTNRTVSRKLRGEVQFTADELLTLANKLNISLDNISLGEDKYRHAMFLSTFDWSPETDYQDAITEAMTPYLLALESPYPKFMVATSTYADTVFYDLELLAKFDYLKWLYFNKGYNKSIPLADYQIDRDFHKKFDDIVKRFRESTYIVSINMISNIAEEILYFYRIKLLTRDEIKELKKTLLYKLSIMEKICLTGYYPGTNKIINLFFSEMNLPNDIIIIDTDNIKMVHITAFFHNTIMSKDNDTIEIIKHWYQTYLRTANIISVSGEMNRIKFFQKQYADLETKLGNL